MEVVEILQSTTVNCSRCVTEIVLEYHLSGKKTIPFFLYIKDSLEFKFYVCVC